MFLYSIRRQLTHTLHPHPHSSTYTSQTNLFLFNTHNSCRRHHKYCNIQTAKAHIQPYLHDMHQVKQPHSQLQQNDFTLIQQNIILDSINTGHTHLKIVGLTLKHIDNTQPNHSKLYQYSKSSPLNREEG